MSKQRQRTDSPRILKAIREDNVFALREMGHAGGRATARKRHVVAEIEQIFAARRDELLEKEMHARAVEANEHICPLD